MNVVDGGHYTFETIGSTYRFVFPYRKERLLILYHGVVIVVVAVVFAPAVLPMLFVNDVQQTGPVALLLYGLIALTIGLMLLELLWQVIGKEVVEISDDALVIKHQVLGLGPAKKFLAGKISAVQVSQQNEWASGLGARRDYRFFNFKRGCVALHSGKSLTGRPVTYRFGTSLDEGEAQQVVAQIISRFPQYKAESRPVDSQPSA